VIPEPTSWEPNRTRQVLHGCDQAVAQAKTLSKSRGLWVHYDGQLYSSQPFTDYKRILKVAEAVKQVGFADVKIREEKTSVVLHDV
jgi:predicted methyltransferase